MKTTVLLFFLWFLSFSVHAQKVQLKGKLIDQNMQPIVNGELSIQEQGLVNFIFSMPDAQTLKENKYSFVSAKTDGSFTLELDSFKPSFVLFASAGKKTIRTIFPPTAKKQVNMEVMLYDTAFVRNESECTINVKDKLIQPWLDVYALSSISANTETVRFIEARGKYKEIHGTSEGFTYDLSGYYQALLKYYDDSKDRSLKNYVLLKLVDLANADKYPVEKKYLLEAIQQISPSDYLWVSESNASNYLYRELGGFKKNKALLLPFLESLIRDCPAPAEKPKLLYSLLCNASSEEIPEAGRYYTELIADYPESAQATMAIANARKLKLSKNKKGDPLPSFSVASLENQSERITNETLKGKFTLIDFWATWCGPCVKQFPNLEKVYAKYKDRGLEILSINLDKEVKTAADFRNKRYKLPWLNGFAGEDNKSLMDLFEFNAIPRILLIDKDGVIISSSYAELTDENLDILLAKVFDEK